MRNPQIHLWCDTWWSLANHRLFEPLLHFTFIFMQFSSNMLPNNWLALPWEILDPPTVSTFNEHISVHLYTRLQLLYQFPFHVVTVIFISGSRSQLTRKNSIRSDVCREGRNRPVMIGLEDLRLIWLIWLIGAITLILDCNYSLITSKSVLQFNRFKKKQPRTLLRQLPWWPVFVVVWGACCNFTGACVSGVSIWLTRFCFHFDTDLEAMISFKIPSPSRIEF